MRDYELIFIVHPDLEAAALEEIVDRVKNWVDDSGGQITKEDRWGTRKLAYPIRKKTEGYYVLLDTRMPAGSVAGIERNLRLLEPLMRFLITAKE